MSTPATRAIASNFVNSCLSHLSKAPDPEAKREEAIYWAGLDQDLGRFKLWAHGLSRHSNRGWELPNDPLDEVLERSKYLKEPTILLLSSFASCLLVGHFKQIGDETTRASLESALQEAITIYPHIEDDRCDSGSDQSQNSAMKELHDIVNSLFELASPLSNILRSLKTPTVPNSVPATGSYENYMRDKFPHARQYLVLRFAQGNAKCYEKLRAQLGSGRVAAPNTSVPTPLPGSGSGIDISFEVAQSVIASRVQSTHFHDSGLGSSHHSSASFLFPPPSVSGQSQTTVFSSTSVLGGRSSMPPMPRDSRSRMGFECSICHCKQKPMTNKHQWRKHVFSDLQPYMCIREGCTGTGESFPSRKEWVAHDNTHKVSDRDSRSSTETCPFCLKGFTSDEGARFHNHISYHMEDIRLFALLPSYRESDDMEDFNNSSDAGGSESTQRALSDIAENDSPQTATANSFHEQLKAYKIPDKDRFLSGWLSSGELPEEQMEAISLRSTAGSMEVIGLITAVGALAIRVRELLVGLSDVGDEFKDVVYQLNHTKEALIQLNSLYKHFTLPAPVLSEQIRQIRQYQDTFNSFEANLRSIRKNLNSLSLFKRFLQKKDLFDKDLQRITNQLSNFNSSLNSYLTLRVIGLIQHGASTQETERGKPKLLGQRAEINRMYTEAATRIQRDYANLHERSPGANNIPDS